MAGRTDGSVISSLTVGTSSQIYTFKPPEYPEKLDSRLREVHVKRKQEKDAQQEEVIDDDPYGGFSNSLDHGIVFKRIDNHMEDLQVDESWVTTQSWTTALAWVMAAGGSFLIVISNTIIKTTVFQSQPELISLCVIGFLMWIPFFVWFWMYFFPTEETKRHRKMIRLKRKLRKKIFFEDVEPAPVEELKEKKGLREKAEFMRRMNELHVAGHRRGG